MSRPDIIDVETYMLDFHPRTAVDVMYLGELARLAVAKHPEETINELYKFAQQRAKTLNDARHK